MESLLVMGSSRGSFPVLGSLATMRDVWNRLGNVEMAGMVVHEETVSAVKASDRVYNSDGVVVVETPEVAGAFLAEDSGLRAVLLVHSR